MGDNMRTSYSCLFLFLVVFGVVCVVGCGSPEPQPTPPRPPGSVLDCSQPAACGIVNSIDGSPANPPPTAYATDQLCALQELAKGMPVRIHYNDGCEGMCIGKVLLVRSDGSVVWQPYSDALDGTGFDLDGLIVEFNKFDTSKLCKIKPASYFETCQMAFDSSCTSASNWVTDCAPLTTLACEP